MRDFRAPLFVGAAAAAIMLTPAAWAETMSHTAELSPSAEVPPTESEGSGTADITVDADAMTAPGPWRWRG